MYNRTTVWPYKVLLLTCVVNCTAGTPMSQLCSVVQWSEHWAPSRMTWVLVLAGARCCALEVCREKKMQALLLGLAKSIYWSDIAHFYFLLGLFFPYLFLTKLVETNSWTSILVSATTFYPLCFQVTDVTSYRIILLL